jgi:hypothetical protein
MGCGEAAGAGVRPFRGYPSPATFDCTPDVYVREVFRHLLDNAYLYQCSAAVAAGAGHREVVPVPLARGAPLGYIGE